MRNLAKQKETYVVKTLMGLESLLIQELEELGAEDIRPLLRGASFKGDLKMLYRANLELRTAIRILKPFWHFQARNEDELYYQIQRINWTKHLTLKHTFAIDSVAHSRYFRHSKYAGLKTKDAIVDQFRDRFDKRPNVNTVSPDLRLNVHIYEDEVNLAYDSSGDSLHMRGYRREVGDAPINEVLAAGMIMLTGWKGDSIFIDPMCGSGTLLAEAAMIASNTPAGWNRERFGFQKWKNFNQKIWDEVLAEAKAKIKKPSHPILGFDSDFKTVRMAERNLDTAGMLDYVEIKRMKFQKLEAPEEKGILVTNPPYDERLKEADILEFYGMIGDQLKQQFKGYEAWLISSNADAIKRIGLRASKKIPLQNGALECRFLKFELYEGSKKAKYQKFKDQAEQYSEEEE